MHPDRTIVLFTRPRPASERAAAELRGATDAAFETLIAPVIDIVGTGAVPDLSGVSGLIFTSANGVAHMGPVPRDLTAWCVGDRTAEAARAAGLDAVSADGDADALVALLLGKRPGGRLLHLRGADARGDVASRLRAAGLDAEEAPVYRQERRALPLPAREALEAASRILAPVYSPRSAAALAEAWPDGVRPPHVVAISPAAAAAWTRPAESLTQAAAPDGPAMIAAIRRVLASHGPCS